MSSGINYYYLLAGLAFVIAGAFGIWLLKRRPTVEHRVGPSPTAAPPTPEKPPAQVGDSRNRTEQEILCRPNTANTGEGGSLDLVPEAPTAKEPKQARPAGPDFASMHEVPADGGDQSLVPPAEALPRKDVEQRPVPTKPELANHSGTESQTQGSDSVPLAEEYKPPSVSTLPASAVHALKEGHPSDSDFGKVGQVEAISPEKSGVERAGQVRSGTEPPGPPIAGEWRTPPTLCPAKSQPGETARLAENATAIKKPEEERQGENAEGGQVESEEVRRPGEYHPPPSGPPKPPHTEPRSAEGIGPTASEERERPLELRLQANPDRHGFCTFRLLAQRPGGWGSELRVRCAGEAVTFIESGDNWYEVLADSNIAIWLSEGVVAHENRRGGPRIEWQLTRRDVHVLAGQPSFSGLVSTTRLCIGRKHIVLCRASRANEVSAVLSEAGCGSLLPRAEDCGAPAGWIFFWPVEPTRSLLPLPGQDILNLLRPQPEIELLLEGGLWLRNSTWLSGYPPQIRVGGVLPPGEMLHIDAKPAQRTDDGAYACLGYDQPGEHRVWCAGKTQSYSISEPEAVWEWWEPHSFREGVICGSAAVPRTACVATPVTVPATNRLLVGARPGEVFLCPAHAGAEWTGFVPFRVVWAVPADALHCDRSRSQVLLVRAASPVDTRSPAKRRLAPASVEWRWCQGIRDCRRKGLAVLPADKETAILWRAYVAYARAYWRRHR